MSDRVMDQPGFAAAVVASWGATDPTTPLVVLLHGRGATETSMAELVPHLPAGPAYVGVRAPISEGEGYAWFANRGIGRPLPESLSATMAWFLDWLDTAAPAGRPVLLLGFSGGAAFAGGLLLTVPHRFAAGVLLRGTLPFDAGVPVTRGRLAGVPVYLAHGAHDTVIPSELQTRTWDYLVRSSGSALWAEREPAGHELMPMTLSRVAQWLDERLTWLGTHGPASFPDPSGIAWPTMADGRLPVRAGEPPQVRAATPQQQQSQNAPVALQEELYARMRELPAVRVAASGISVPGARAILLDRTEATGPDEAFVLPEVGEFAHLHPSFDGSLHLTLPPDLLPDALVKGWAIAHPLAGIRLTTGMVMVFGPRDEHELDVVTGIVAASHGYAAGKH